MYCDRKAQSQVRVFNYFTVNEQKYLKKNMNETRFFYCLIRKNGENIRTWRERKNKEIKQNTIFRTENREEKQKHC